MKYIKKIINFCIYLLIKLRFLKLPNRSLRVLMFHDVSDLNNFSNQITILIDEETLFFIPLFAFNICYLTS